ncbi:cell cycle progression protein 1 [Gouania willdenowi]|uniref:Cell cycle progression protein 1 n=1 Tax=Gouania willdenowi TaxID=441366 RepID=A0A8C5I6N4_GOUWI|nr:cell cycle progression protein 1 [Gouania willdenowi]XP_028298986.1 cell cycle progression protein 1 [Gouania willdenowi]
MSETSSDTESSCGWTIISNEGSDIETLVPEAAVENEARPLEHPPVEEEKPESSGVCVEEDASFDDTPGEQTLDETLYASKAEAEDDTAEKVPVSSFSDHSDIVTLGDVKDHNYTEQEAAPTDDLYLGMSCSSHYAFTPADPVLPAQKLTLANTSSSEDEAKKSPYTVVRRRRLRKNTTSLTDTNMEDVMPESNPSEEEKVAKEQSDQEEEPDNAPAAVHTHSRCRSILITCVLLTPLVIFCMSVSRLYDNSDSITWESEYEEFFCCHDDFDDIPVNFGEADYMEPTEESYDINEVSPESAGNKAQRDAMQALLTKEAEERKRIPSNYEWLMADNQQLKDSLEHEKKSLATLQEELRKLRSQMKDLEKTGAGAEVLLLENQMLKEQLEEEKQLIKNVHMQMEDAMSEVQMLKQKLERERKVTDQLRRDLNALKSQIPEEEMGSEAEELRSRLSALEVRLSYEQQRSDLWERLYVETKEERAKGDTDSKVKKTKSGISGKVKQTFDAVKNSTKEFVLHHKEQINKAKQAVNENLRKFSDSVKSTFRHFKDSASTFIHKARGFYNKKHEKDTKESWQRRQKPLQKQEFTFHSSHNTRKSGDKVQQEGGQSHQKPNIKDCFGVFDCAYQESMSMFDKATEPIRADEFSQLLHSYVQQEVDHFYHWKELESFTNNFFQNGVFVHNQMLFTDFVNSVKDYLAGMHQYHSPDDKVFEDFDEFVYRHFFGKPYTKTYVPRGPFQRPNQDLKKESKAKHQQRKQQKARSRAHSERKWSRSGGNADRHMADVKIELGPMPFDPKY